jgi:hypothetical protein
MATKPHIVSAPLAQASRSVSNPDFRTVAIATPDRTSTTARVYRVAAALGARALTVPKTGRGFLISGSQRHFYFLVTRT